MWLWITFFVFVVSQFIALLSFVKASSALTSVAIIICVYSSLASMLLAVAIAIIFLFGKDKSGNSLTYGKQPSYLRFLDLVKIIMIIISAISINLSFISIVLYGELK